jgi:aspartyl-tRNA(Asn)/glutamyl-tRNA(Gln) amidotransferase subunit B
MERRVSQRIVKSYKVLIGMEIHVQLATKSKMFTGAANGFGGEPNTQVDEQVLGLPGTLPVLNKRAVEYAIKVGLALGCTIAKHTKWDRKSYFYPDLPKNYQISQYDLPLCAQGTFELLLKDGSAKTIRIRRAHLEEDAGKLLHEAPGGYKIDFSIVDLNRAGTPLLEIVTEPDLSSGEEVAAFGQELQKIVQYLGVSHGQMQMGHMRFEPNINVHITDPEGKIHKTAITEIKNLNSFSVLERAATFEIQRQIREWVETGSLGRKSTYGWDESSESTYWQRDKEEAHDYRYFPDPDLVPVDVDEAWLRELKSQVGELPAARRKRYAEVLGLSPAEAAVLAQDRHTGDFFEESVQIAPNPKGIANLIVNTLAQWANEQHCPVYELGIEPARVAQIAECIKAGTVAPSRALQVFKDLGPVHLDAAALDQELTERGLKNVNDQDTVDSAIESVLSSNPPALRDYRAGKQAAFNALFGMVMKNAKGLNPKMVQEQLRKKLDESS